MRQNKAYLYFPVSEQDFERLGIDDETDWNITQLLGIYLTAYDVKLGLERWKKGGSLHPTEATSTQSTQQNPDELSMIIETNVALTTQVQEHAKMIKELRAKIKIKDGFINSYKMQYEGVVAERDRLQQRVKNVQSPQKRLNKFQQFIVKVLRI